MFYSQCPECSAVRVVATEEIGSGDIVVICESCGESYNLAWHLLDRLPSIRQNDSDNDSVKDKLRVDSELQLPPPFQPDWSLPGLNADSELNEPETKTTAVAKPPAAASNTSPASVSAPAPTPASGVASDRDGIELPAPRITREQQQPIVNTPPLTQALAPVLDNRSAPPPPAALNPPGSADPATDAVAREPVSDPFDSTTFDSTETEIYGHSEPLEDAESESAADRAAARRRRRKRKRQKEKKKAVTRARYWALGSVGLVLLLGLQIRMFYLDTVFRSSDSQPVAGFFCKVFSCPTPLPRDLGLLQINNTAVGNHPDVPNAIRISTTVSNVAEHDQAYPDVQLTLTDPNGNVISRRTFSPGQYVPGYVEGREILQSAETNTFNFDISNPSKRAIGFEVELVQ